MVAVGVLAACQSGTGATTTSGVATTLPPAEVLESQRVEPCQADDGAIVSADVADLGGHLVADEEGVWLSRFGSPDVLHIEGATLCPESPIAVPGADLGVAAMTVGDDGRVFVASAQSGAVSVIDPGGAEAVALTADPSGGGGLAMAAGHLWAACCDPGGAVGASGVFDAATGELIAEIDIGPASGVALTSDAAWMGRTDRAGLYRVVLTETGAEVEMVEGTGNTTYAVVSAGEEVYLVGDEPVLQRWAGEGIEDTAVLPFPRERPADLAATPDGSVFAVSAFSPGVFWVRDDGQTFTLGSAQNLIQVEVAGDRLWTLDTGGTLTRIEWRSLDG